ncbi:MAG: pitrilysin family protein [Patescibacteria group bacterium]
MTFSKQTLPNGLRVILVPEADAMAATVLVLVETGSKYESKRINGISHFLEHMCFKGTTKRPRSIDISSELDSLGAQYNAFTSQEYTGYYAKVQPLHVSKALEIVADLYQNPTFDAKEIEKEKGVIVEEINMYEDMPHRRAGELLLECMYGEQPAGWPIAGTPDIVRTFTRDDFVAYRAAHYLADSTLVVVAGKFDEKAVLLQIEKEFAGIVRSEKGGKLAVTDTQKAPEIVIKHKESDQSHLALGVRSRPLAHKDTFVLEVLAGILGGGMSSRLFEKVREEMGAAYYVRAGNDAYTDHGAFGVAAGVDHRKLDAVIEAILGEMKKLKTEDVGERELEKVKQSFVGDLYLGLEKSDEIANFYGGQEILKRETLTPEEMASRVQAVTAADVRRVANEIFVTEHLNLALIGPFKEKDRFVKLLSLS